MQLPSVDSSVQNKAPCAVDASADQPSSRHVSFCDNDTYGPGSFAAPRLVPPTLALLKNARSGPPSQADGKSAESYMDLARHQLAVGHVRQAIDLVGRGIDADCYATDQCLMVLWEQPVLGQLPNVLRHVLTRFDTAGPEFKIYQWLLMLSYHAKGSRQLGLRVLGQAINSVNDGKFPMVGSLQVPSVEHWLRNHGMADVVQGDFWNGVDPTSSVSKGITQARCRFINALSLADEHLPETLPLVKALCGPQRQVLVSLSAPQTMRLLELHARRERGLVLSEDEVHAMVSTLSEKDRLLHLGRALICGHPFHVSALLASGVMLSDVPKEAVNNRTCQDRYLVDKLLDSGVPPARLADLMVRAPEGTSASGKLPPLPASSLEALLQRQLAPDHRLQGQADGPTLLWEAVRRKDAATVKLLRDYNADCNAIMRIKHQDGTEGFTTPGIFALAHGDAATLRAMRMKDATDLLPGINMMLEAVKRIS